MGAFDPTDFTPQGQTQWYDLIQMYYGVNLNQDQSILWMNELTLRFGEAPSNADLCGAIRHASEKNLTPGKYKATVRDLIHWLGSYWAEERAKRAKEQVRLPLIAEQFIEFWGDKLSAYGELTYDIEADFNAAASVFMTEQKLTERDYYEIVARVLNGWERARLAGTQAEFDDTPF